MTFLRFSAISAPLICFLIHSSQEILALRNFVLTIGWLKFCVLGCESCGPLYAYFNKNKFSVKCEQNGVCVCVLNKWI